VARRDETLTALQALALLNNRFVVRMAEHFAARLEREVPGDPDAQVARGIELALGRPADGAEVQTLSALARTHGLPAACRAVFNLNEFVFVD
jgi:hypothetical protein